MIFAIDAAIFPALPEIFIVLFFSLYSQFGTAPAAWAAVLLAVAITGDVVGNALLYSFVRNALIRRKKMPRMLERAMQRWTSLLLVRDERVILLNRIAPVVPLTGAFIAVSGWNLRRSLRYVVIGGAAKYMALLALAAWFGVIFPPETAQLGTLVAVATLVTVSIAIGRYRRKRLGAPQ